MLSLCGYSRMDSQINSRGFEQCSLARSAAVYLPEIAIVGTLLLSFPG
jgi:hypothetical protein